jgi:2-desacetyl-2-hydroxyethyl bacteriochlorophyllide A dehydrogenase
MERPREVTLRTIQLTEKRPDSIVARTLISAISSGTDMKTYRGEQHPEQCYYPLVPGYENVGVIEEIGPEAKTDLKVGDRVMINECRKFGDVCSAWGGSVEIAIKDSVTAPSPFDYMVKIPDNISNEDAVLGYLACVALKGIRRLSFGEADTVLVVGAGMVGISAVQIVKILSPAATVICFDSSETRCAIARHYADHVFLADGSEVDKIKEVSCGKMADKVIECSGHADVVSTLHQYVKDGGWGADDEPAHIHLQGDYPERIILDHWHRWFVKNCTITMTCALAAGCKEQILQWMSEGKFDTSHLPVEVWPVEKCSEAFAYKEEKGEDVFKILFDWQIGDK